MKIAKSFYLLLIIVSILLINSCQQHDQKPGIKRWFSEHADSSVISEIKYASGFDAFRYEGVTKLVVYHPELSQVIVGEYYLANREFAEKFRDTSNLIIIPADSVAIFSATQLNAFDRLGILDKIIGVSEAEYITNKSIKKKIDEGATFYFLNKT